MSAVLQQCCVQTHLEVIGITCTVSQTRNISFKCLFLDHILAFVRHERTIIVITNGAEIQSTVLPIVLHFIFMTLPL